MLTPDSFLRTGGMQVANKIENQIPTESISYGRGAFEASPALQKYVEEDDASVDKDLAEGRITDDVIALDEVINSAPPIHDVAVYRGVGDIFGKQLVSAKEGEILHGGPSFQSHSLNPHISYQFSEMWEWNTKIKGWYDPSVDKDAKVSRTIIQALITSKVPCVYIGNSGAGRYNTMGIKIPKEWELLVDRNQRWQVGGKYTVVIPRDKYNEIEDTIYVVSIIPYYGRTMWGERTD